MFRLIRAALLVALACRPALAAEAVPARSGTEDGWRGFELRLGLSEPVPYRISFLDGPPRLVLDLEDLDWAGLAPAGLTSRRVREARLGRNLIAPGWSRAVMVLDRPYGLDTAVIDPAGVLRLRLSPVDAARFAALARPEGPQAAETARPVQRQRSGRALNVVIDPGHGGRDPGAEAGGTDEAALMLDFARELAVALGRTGRFNVILTRDSDVFVPLEARLSVAQTAGADVFLSLHADALAEGQASGATVYAFAEGAAADAAGALTLHHGRTELLQGLDLTGTDDALAGVLMDLSRTQTSPRSRRLADRLVEAIRASGAGPLYKTPRREAGFAVLKSPGVPSVLVELGYLSNPADFARIADPAWRAGMAGAIANGLEAWADEDAAKAALLRR